MKKIFTLLFATAMLGTAFAQYGQQGQQNRGPARTSDVYETANDEYGYYEPGNRHGYFFTARERNRQIAQINHEYDHKIRAIQGRMFMNGFQKRRLINHLIARRNQEIQQVELKFNSPMNKFGQHKRYKKYRKNNW